MKTSRTTTTCVLLTLLGFVASANAALTEIDYTLTGPGGPGAYAYSYTANNVPGLAGGAVLGFFDVFFPEIDDPTAPLYSLAGATAPAGWSGNVYQYSEPGDMGGYAEFIASSGGIAVGHSLSGFTVSFSYAGAGTPGSQYYEIYDPVAWNLLDSGHTTLYTPPPAIPRPRRGLLLAWRRSCR